MSEKLKGKALPTEAELGMNDPHIEVVSKEEIEMMQGGMPEEIASSSIKREPTPQSYSKAKEKLQSFMGYLQSQQYQDDLTQLSVKYNVPRQKLANRFLAKMFATIGDVTGIVIETTRYTLQTLIRIVSGILTTGVNLVCNLANSLCRILTFNQTNC